MSFANVWPCDKFDGASWMKLIFWYIRRKFLLRFRETHTHATWDAPPDQMT